MSYADNSISKLSRFFKNFFLTELESLMDGIATNAKKEEEYLKGESTVEHEGDATDFMNFMMNGGMGL